MTKKLMGPVAGAVDAVDAVVEVGVVDEVDIDPAHAASRSAQQAAAAAVGFFMALGWWLRNPGFISPPRAAQGCLLLPDATLAAEDGQLDKLRTRANVGTVGHRVTP